MDLKDKSTFLMVLIGVLWVVITIMGWTGYWFPAMFLGIILMLIHMMMGAAKNGKLHSKLLLYPFLVWAVLWVISFGMSYYHGNLFAGRMPEFTILGLHPSFSWTVLTYWIGGVLTLNLGFILYKDLWLSNEEWADFKKKIDQLNQQKGGTYSGRNS